MREGAKIGEVVVEGAIEGETIDIRVIGEETIGAEMTEIGILEEKIEVGDMKTGVIGMRSLREVIENVAQIRDVTESMMIEEDMKKVQRVLRNMIRVLLTRKVIEDLPEDKTFNINH